jgi:signal transduction histidine kinase
MLDRLASAFEHQRQFLDDVAHELRTPITIVQGHLDLLGDDPAERDETVAIVTDELERMNRYVNDLLLLAKATRPDFLRSGPVDLGELAATTLRTLIPLADRAWSLDEAPPAGRWIVDADAERLTQALVNLASNAVDHTAPGDTIALGIRVEPVAGSTTRLARLWIRDTGVGIDPAIAATLFQRNERGASSRGARPEGMGIGLSIVAAIAQAHGGTATVASTDGGGATFEISFEFHPDEPGAPLPPPRLAPSPRTQETTIP